jgi:hypothetical protein
VFQMWCEQEQLSGNWVKNRSYDGLNIRGPVVHDQCIVLKRTSWAKDGDNILDASITGSKPPS